MPSPFSVSLRAPRYIRKYLIAESKNKVEPLTFRNFHPVSQSINELRVNYHTQRYFPLNEKRNIFEYFRTRQTRMGAVLLAIPYHITKNPLSYNYIGFQSKVFMLSEIKRSFYGKLMKHIEKRMLQHITKRIAIEEFCAMYDITEDDVKFETLYRQSTRILSSN